MSTVISQIRTYQGLSYKANIIPNNDYIYAERYFHSQGEEGVTMSKKEWAKLPFAKIESVDL